MTEQPTVSTTRPMSLMAGLIRAVRPKQWAKNGLVFVAPGAAGVLTEGRTLLYAVAAFCIFSMAAGGTYLLNDAMDVESDRRHPTKRYRPIAAGIVPVSLALVLAPVFIVTAVLLALWRNWQFGLIVALYVILTTMYSFWLKHQPVLDLVGPRERLHPPAPRRRQGDRGPDLELVPHHLLLRCAVHRHRQAAGRAARARRGLGVVSGDARGLHRHLPELPEGRDRRRRARRLLRVRPRAGRPVPVVARRGSLLSTIPFIVAILRYALLVEQGQGSAPEELLFNDRQMQVIGLVWVALMGLSVYAK